MVVLGVGIGLVMQVLILATQNSVPVRDLGVATSSVNFFRSVGGSVGVALFGALFNARLSAGLSGQIGGTITPQAIVALPAAQQATVVDIFANALTNVFLIAVPVMLVAFALSWFLPEVPLQYLRLDPGPRQGRRGGRPRGRPHRDRPRGPISCPAVPLPGRAGTAGTRPKQQDVGRHPDDPAVRGP